jgi:hypothetical protein
VLKLIVLAVLVVLIVRYVPPVRVWTAERLEGLARELRRARGRRGESRRWPDGGIEDATEVMNTRAATSSRGPRALLWVDGRTAALRDGMTIGRDDSCDIRLSDSRVSRHHARVRVQRGVAKLEDLGSRNGTRVGGRDIDGLYTLSDGDMVSFGGSIAARFAYDEQTMLARRPVGGRAAV